MKRLIVVAMAAIFLVACGDKKPKPMTADEIYNECASGVVMVLNHYYTTLTMPWGEKYYWSENYGDVGLSNDESAIIEYRDTKIGTGFFISQIGEIITDMGVANPQIDWELLEMALINFCDSNSSQLGDTLQSLTEELKRVQYRIANAEFWGQAPTAKDIARRTEINNLYAQTEGERQKWATLTLDEIKTDIVTDIRVAYNNTTITNLNDLEEAEFIDEPGDEHIAVVQLKSRAPIPSTHIFAINYEGKGSTLEVGHPIYIIYFVGEYDVLTPIKAKLAVGTAIETFTEGEFIESLPTIQNEFLAPIIDEYGNLIFF